MERDPAQGGVEETLRKSPSTRTFTYDQAGSLESVGSTEKERGPPSGSWKCADNAAGEVTLAPCTTLMSGSKPEKIGGWLGAVPFSV